MFLSQEQIEKINHFLIEKVQPYFIIVFGSAVKTNFREDSDIDIAFLSEESFSEYEIFMMGQQLADLLNREIDLVDLKNASTVFKAQIVGHGKTTYCRDENRRMYFEMRSLKEYALLNEERKTILEQIKERGHIFGE